MGMVKVKHAQKAYADDRIYQFDISDPEQHFGRDVPQIAQFCSSLFNAVLSTSARHFATLPDYRQKEMTVKLDLEEDLIIREAAT